MDSKFIFDRNSNRLDVNYTDYYWFADGFTSDELHRIEGMTLRLPFQKQVLVKMIHQKYQTIGPPELNGARKMKSGSGFMKNCII
jgi:hypothetical protein